jgi:transcriptional regulator with XRE-family HTH domain
MLKDKVKEIRKEMELTQEEFAKNLNISRSYLGDIETGRLKGTNVKIISKLSDVTGKPIEYFLEKNAKIIERPPRETTFDICEKLKLYRKNNSLTQSEFANKVGVSRTTITELENSTKKVTLKTLEKIAKGTNTLIEKWIINEKDSLTHIIDTLYETGEINDRGEVTKEGIAILEREIKLYIENKKLF